MNKQRKILLLLVFLYLIPVFLQAADSNSKKLSAHKTEIETLRLRIESLSKEISITEAANLEARDLLRNTEQTISKQQKKLFELTEQKTSLKDQLIKLNRQQKEIERVVLIRRSQIDNLIRYQYQQGGIDAIRLILNGNDPNQIMRELYYLSLITQAHNGLVISLTEGLKRKVKLNEDIETKVKHINDIESNEQNVYEQLVEKRKQHQSLINDLNRKIVIQRNEMGSLSRDQQHLTRLITRLQQIISVIPQPPQQGSSAEVVKEEKTKSELAKQKALNQGNATSAIEKKFSSMKGDLVLPTRGVIVNRFGSEREQGQVWKGVFIKASEGQDVKSVAAGRVVFAEWLRGFGNLLILDHGENYLSIYGYTEALLKAVGDTVKHGELIARVGSSGGYTESGLYFEIRFKGEPLDPLKWIRGK